MLSTDVLAGGGPENVFLVVNERSWSSLSIANHYVRLRKIPVSNVFYVDWADDNERIDAATARQKLIGPIMAEIRRRGIADHIDYVVYSADFPWLVDCSADPTGGEALPAVVDPRASLTGVTYFHKWFLQGQKDFRYFRANGYYRPTDGIKPPASHGFRSWYGWNEQGELLEAGGMNYMLSAMLGVTSGRGNSTEEVIAGLISSIDADHEKPEGTFYYTRTQDVRSTTRAAWFAPAAEAVRKAGGKAEIVDVTAPANKTDALGLMLGSPTVSLREAGTKLLPGALVENLTSVGGDLSSGAGQTPITDFMRAGAAQSSGAVFEPFAVEQKFPTAFMFLHYLRGCSAAEAFYQATNGPYQLLLLGDPLCRPFAPRATISLAGLEDNQVLKGDVRFSADGGFEGNLPAARMELYVDGLLHSFCLPGGALSIDTRALPDGAHDFRVMAVGGPPLEHRGGLSVPIVVANNRRQVILSTVGQGPFRWYKPLRIYAEADEALNASGIVIMQGTRRIAQIPGPRGDVVIEPRTLGVGPVGLTALALGPTGGAGDAVSAPVEVYIEPSEPLSGYELGAGAPAKPGVSLVVAGEKPRSLEPLVFDNILADAKVADGKTFTLTGLFRVEEDGLHQFQLRHAMELELRINDRPHYRAENERVVVDYVPVSLKRGLHKLEFVGKASKISKLNVRFGLRGVQTLSPATMSHLPADQKK